MPSQKKTDLIEVKTSTTEQAVEELSFREVILPPSVRELRQKLGQKAKQQKRFCFYSLYGLVCRCDVLASAAGGRGKASAFMLTCNTWAWWRCERFLAEPTLARAGWGKPPCAVRRGRGKRRSLVDRPFTPCFPLYSTVDRRLN